MASHLQQVAGPQYGVIGVCWFDTDTDTNYDWHVDQTTAAWQAWLALAATRTSAATARNVLYWAGVSGETWSLPEMSGLCLAMITKTFPFT